MSAEAVWTRDKIIALAEEHEVEGALLADGFEAAFIGFGSVFTHSVAIYDYGACLRILQERDGMNYEEAVECFEYNTAGAWVGEHTPVFMRLCVNAVTVSGTPAQT